MKTKNIVILSALSATAAVGGFLLAKYLINSPKLKKDDIQLPEMPEPDDFDFGGDE